MNSKQPYQIELFSFFKIVLICILLISSIINNYSMVLVLVFLCIWSCFGIKEAIEALSLSIIIKYLNPALASFPYYSGIFFWGIIYLVCLNLILRSQMKYLKTIIPIFYFYIVILGLSFWSSQPLISILKATSFCFVIASLILSCKTINEKEILELKKWFFSLALAILLLSIPTWFFPNIGFNRNGVGFQGILNHPQAFGIFWPPFILFILYSLIYRLRKVYLIDIIFLLIMVFACLTSRSRTAYSSILFGIIITSLFIIFSPRLKEQINLKKLIAISIIIILLIMPLIIIPGYRNEFMKLVIKSEENRTIKEAFYHSRGRIIAIQWKNFLKRPLTGNGFGVYAEGYFPSGIKYFLGIPISASVEKGIIFTAILEEIGIIGILAFVVFMILLIYPFTKSINIPTIAMFWGCIGVNIGEAIFFSIGGNGLFYWLIIILTYSMVNKNEKYEKIL